MDANDELEHQTGSPLPWPPPSDAAVQPAPPSWPSASPQPGVWPPPPAAAISPQMMDAYPFKFLAYTVKGPISDFREGTVYIDQTGFTIDGKAVPRAEIRVPIQIVAFVILRVIGLVIAECIFRYAMIRPAQCRVAWESVTQIALNEKKRHIGLVYMTPNQSGKVVSQSLAFKLPAPQFDQFVNTTRQFIPDRVGIGRVGNPAAIVALVLIVLFLIAISVFALLPGSSGH